MYGGLSGSNSAAKFREQPKYQNVYLWIFRRVPGVPEAREGGKRSKGKRGKRGKCGHLMICQLQQNVQCLQWSITDLVLDSCLTGTSFSLQSLFRIQSVLPINILLVTKVNQDHLHSMIQFSLERTEPGNTLPCTHNAHTQYNAIHRNSTQYWVI